VARGRRRTLGFGRLRVQDAAAAALPVLEPSEELEPLEPPLPLVPEEPPPVALEELEPEPSEELGFEAAVSVPEDDAALSPEPEEGRLSVL
jgi:hypothetical protein